MKGNPVELRLHQGLKFNALGFFCSVDGGFGLEERERGRRAAAWSDSTTANLAACSYPSYL